MHYVRPNMVKDYVTFTHPMEYLHTIKEIYSKEKSIERKYCFLNGRFLEEVMMSCSTVFANSKPHKNSSPPYHMNHSSSQFIKSSIKTQSVLAYAFQRQSREQYCSMNTNLMYSVINWIFGKAEKTSASRQSIAQSLILLV